MITNLLSVSTTIFRTLQRIIGRNTSFFTLVAIQSSSASFAEHTAQHHFSNFSHSLNVSREREVVQTLLSFEHRTLRSQHDILVLDSDGYPSA